MRIVLVACVVLPVALGGCMSKENLEAWQAQQAYERQRQANYEASPAGRADLGCRTKTQFAMAGHQSRSFLDLEGTAKANQMHASCMEYWRRTGQMP